MGQVYVFMKPFTVRKGRRRSIQGPLNFQEWKPWNTVDGSESRQTHHLRLVVYPHYLQGFIYPRWLFGIFVHQHYGELFTGGNLVGGVLVVSLLVFVWCVFFSWKFCCWLEVVSVATRPKDLRYSCVFDRYRMGCPPPKDASHHQDYYSFSRGQPKV